jgi:hypothetical protein
MQLVDKDFPLTRKQVQAYIDSKAAGDVLAQAGDGRYCLLAQAYRFHHPEADVFVNYDLIDIDGEDYYFKPWQRGLMRREDRRFGAE